LKVILDGQGSDELNLGYDKYFKYAFSQMLADGKLNQCLKYTSNLFSYHSPAHAIIFILNSFSPQILSDFLRRLFGFSRVSDLSELVYLSNNMSLFEFESLLIQKIMLPNHLLYLDKNSMNYSIEARSPFLDHNIVEFSLSLSASQRLVKGRRKGLLLDSMESLLPKSIYERKNKLGFKSDDNQILRDIGSTHTNFRTYTIERWRKIYFGA
jgi:asparagine synthase (glutamine-hydrolysing)